MKAGDLKQTQHLEGQFFPRVKFFPSNMQAKMVWSSSPCLARARACLNSHPCRLSLNWSIFQSGILPLASVAFCIRPVFQGDLRPKHKPALGPALKRYLSTYSPVCLGKNFQSSDCLYLFIFSCPVPLPQAAISLPLCDQCNCMHLY